MGVCGCVYQMVSAERVIQYSSLEPEASLETRPPNEKPSPDWPQRGEIILDDVSFRYSKDTPLVLKSLSLIINPAEKVNTLAPIGNSALFCYAGWHCWENWGRKVLTDCTAFPVGGTVW